MRDKVVLSIPWRLLDYFLIRAAGSGAVPGRVVRAVME